MNRRGGIPCGCGPIVAGAIGPEVDQARALAGSAALGLVAGTVAQGRPDGFTGDQPSPQQFVNHPRLADAVNTTAVGDDTALESLPGRLSPSAWDGEPGWLAAIGGTDR